MLFADDRNRCRLSAVPGVEGSDYINASFIDVMTPYRWMVVKVIHTLSTGLPQGKGLHSHPRPTSRHTGRFLEVSVAAKECDYCHAHQREGGRKGSSAPPLPQPCRCESLFAYCRPSVIATGPRPEQRRTGSCRSSPANPQTSQTMS